jgi:hypothetical protein
LGRYDTGAPTAQTAGAGEEQEEVIPIPNQGAIHVGSSSAPHRALLYAFVASILAVLISFLI